MEKLSWLVDALCPLSFFLFFLPALDGWSRSNLPETEGKVTSATETSALTTADTISAHPVRKTDLVCCVIAIHPLHGQQLQCLHPLSPVLFRRSKWTFPSPSLTAMIQKRNTTLSLLVFESSLVSGK